MQAGAIVPSRRASGSDEVEPALAELEDAVRAWIERTQGPFDRAEQAGPSTPWPDAPPELMPPIPDSGWVTEHADEG